MKNLKITKMQAGEYDWKIGKAEGYISKTHKGWEVHQIKPYFNSDTLETFKEAKESLQDDDEPR